MNARGIPPAAQQVHAMLFWLGLRPPILTMGPDLDGGYPILLMGVPPPHVLTWDPTGMGGFPNPANGGGTLWDGVPPPPSPDWGWGYPLVGWTGVHPRRYEHTKILPTVIIRMRAVIIEEDRYQAVKV